MFRHASAGGWTRYPVHGEEQNHHEDTGESESARHETQDVAKGRLLLGLLERSDENEPAALRELQLARQVALAIGHRLLVAECDVALSAANAVSA